MYHGNFYWLRNKLKTCLIGHKNCTIQCYESYYPTLLSSISLRHVEQPYFCCILCAALITYDLYLYPTPCRSLLLFISHTCYFGILIVLPKLLKPLIITTLTPRSHCATIFIVFASVPLPLDKLFLPTCRAEGVFDELEQCRTCHKVIKEKIFGVFQKGLIFWLAYDEFSIHVKLK